MTYRTCVISKYCVSVYLLPSRDLVLCVRSRPYHYQQYQCRIRRNATIAYIILHNNQSDMYQRNLIHIETGIAIDGKFTE